MVELLTKDEAYDLVDAYMNIEESVSSTQDILDSGAVPRLKGYVLQPGKVSDSIFGGEGKYKDKKNDEIIGFENPALNAKGGLPIRNMVRTERVSTHDIIRGNIPFKDQILALNHNYMRRMVQGVLGNSQFEVPGLEDNAVVISSENLTQIPFENVHRAYMAKSSTATSLYQHFIVQGRRNFCGHNLPEDLFPNGPLPYVMDTPSTKSDEHDESVAPDYLFKNGLVMSDQYEHIKNNSLVAFGIVSKFAKDRGLIFVDTKTEHGMNREGKLVSQDELYTMDSSRFWVEEDYNHQLNLYLTGKVDALVDYLKETQPGIKEKDYIVNGEVIICPRSYSKEFARDFSEGDKGYTDDQRREIAVRYIEGIQNLTGQKFEPDMRPRDERVIDGLEKVVRLAA